jgi:hypothetical protein
LLLRTLGCTQGDRWRFIKSIKIKGEREGGMWDVECKCRDMEISSIRWGGTLHRGERIWIYMGDNTWMIDRYTWVFCSVGADCLMSMIINDNH